MVFLALIGFVALIAEARDSKLPRLSLHPDLGSAHLQKGPQNVLSVFTTTWNMGNQNGSNENVVSNETLMKWLFPAENDENETSQQCPDLFIIATEEQRIGASETLTTKKEDLKRNHDEWVNRVSTFLNATCEVALTKLDKHIGATSLMVFSKDDLKRVKDFTILRGFLKDASYISPVSSVSLGVNKGFAVIQFEHPKASTPIVAVAGHIAAHEGEQYSNRRTDDLNSLLENPLIKKESTMFLAGDLNIRIANDDDVNCRKEDIRRKMAISRGTSVQNASFRRKAIRGQKKRSHPSDKKKSDESFFKQFLDNCDELVRNDSGHLRPKGPLAEFKELPIDFRPTFKVKVNGDEDIEYDPKRAPAWTDRVLVRLGDGITLVDKTASYKSNEGVRGSDHMPVYLRSDFELASQHKNGNIDGDVPIGIR